MFIYLYMLYNNDLKLYRGHVTFVESSNIRRIFEIRPFDRSPNELSRVGCLKAFQQNSLAHLPVTGTGATVKYCYVFCSGLLDEFHAGRLKPQASPVVQIFAGNQDEFDAES